ncbi:sigma-70 family RNA polymerase sigma factor [uncultured Dietzia sp.]|uniref:sigma-70 family RNA polymerase sigma factor n=1 Tax=uncultured Dietzia sp. TaxID=395519 RepID=UPI0025D4BE86|nr:sigma-70 family RNA polymerase sigma factor [uncultured Dietzia sp.]
MDRDRVLEFFTADRPRLVRLAARILADPAEAEDIVQQAWLRLDRADTSAIDSPGAWLTTVVTRLCLDRLKARVPVPVADDTGDGRAAVSPVDPVDDVVLVDSVGAALHVVVDRLSPTERVAFVLHDSFGVEFAAIAEILDCTPATARKLASRARARVGGGRGPGADTTGGSECSADAAVVDAFLAAARHGEFARLVSLLAPDVVVVGDPVAVGIGTPERIEGRDAVAEFFNGAAAAALPVHVDDRPGAAWFDRGAARVAFDFLVADGVVSRIDFRAEERVLQGVRRRRRAGPVTSGAPESSEE